MKKISFVVIGDEEKFVKIAHDLTSSNYGNLEALFATKSELHFSNFTSLNFHTTDVGEIKNLALTLIKGEYVVFLHTDHFYSDDYFQSLFLKINEGYQVVFTNNAKLFKNLGSPFKPFKHLKSFYFFSVYGHAFSVDLIKKRNLKFLHQSSFYFLPFLHGLLFSVYLGCYIPTILYFEPEIQIDSNLAEPFLVSELYLQDTSFSKKKYLQIQKKYKKLISRTILQKEEKK